MHRTIPVFNPYQDSLKSDAGQVIEENILRTPPKPVNTYKGFDHKKQDLSIVKLSHLNGSKVNKNTNNNNKHWNEENMSNSDKMINEYMDKIHEVVTYWDFNF